MAGCTSAPALVNFLAKDAPGLLSRMLGEKNKCVGKSAVGEKWRDSRRRVDARAAAMPDVELPTLAAPLDFVEQRAADLTGATLAPEAPAEGRQAWPLGRIQPRDPYHEAVAAVCVAI